MCLSVLVPLYVHIWKEICPAVYKEILTPSIPWCVIIAVPLPASADILYVIYLLVGMFIEAAQVKYLAQCPTVDIEPTALLHRVQFPNHNQFAPLKDEVSARVVLCIPHRQWSIPCLISCSSMSLSDVTRIPMWWLDPWLCLQLPCFFLLTHKMPSPLSERKWGMSEEVGEKE